MRELTLSGGLNTEGEGKGNEKMHKFNHFGTDKLTDLLTVGF